MSVVRAIFASLLLALPVSGATLLFSDDFESGLANWNVNGGNVVNPANTVVTAEHVSGTHALQFARSASSSENYGQNDGMVYSLAATRTQIYYKFKWKPLGTLTCGAAGGCHGWRLYSQDSSRQFDTGDAGSNQFKFESFWPTQVPGACTTTVFPCYVGLIQDSSANHLNKLTVNMGQWNTIEYFFKLNTVGNSDGVLKIWANGVLQVNYTGINWSYDGTKPIKNFALNTNYDGHSVVWYFDDVELWDDIPNGSPTLGVSLTSNPAPAIGAAPLAGVVFTTTPGPTGTGPNYRHRLDCNNDGIYEANFTAANSAAHTFGGTVCNALYTSPSSPTYTAVGVIEDYGAGVVGVDPVLTTATSSLPVTVTGSISQCPNVTPPAAAQLSGFKAYDASATSTVFDSNLQNGDTIDASDHPCIALEAVGNAYLTGTPGSVATVLDGVTQPCENNPPYIAGGDNGGLNFPCNAAARTVQEHTLLATPYDQDGCGANSGIAGAARSVTYTVVP